MLSQQHRENLCNRLLSQQHRENVFKRMIQKQPSNFDQ